MHSLCSKRPGFTASGLHAVQSYGIEGKGARGSGARCRYDGKLFMNTTLTTAWPSQNSHRRWTLMKVGVACLSLRSRCIFSSVRMV